MMKEDFEREMLDAMLVIFCATVALVCILEVV